jgi:hypothetical protein
LKKGLTGCLKLGLLRWEGRRRTRFETLRGLALLAEGWRRSRRWVCRWMLVSWGPDRWGHRERLSSGVVIRQLVLCLDRRSILRRRWDIEKRRRRFLLEAMVRGELTTAEDVLGFATPAHDFVQQRGGATGVPIIQERRETGERPARV